MSGERHAELLTDRLHERSVIDRLVNAVRAGRSQVLVLHGEAGVGKTALLGYLTTQSAGCRMVHAAGVQSEMELAFAGLHQLCAPLLEALDTVPGPQQAALRTAFGISAGPAPDLFLVGLAVLSLLSAAAEDQPLVVVVDDAQWLDRASAQALGFAGRRLAADPVGLVFATRTPGEEVAGLSRLAVDGLHEPEAQELLDSVLTWPVDARVRDQIVVEAQGNPLALLELSRGLSTAEMAGGFGIPDTSPVQGRIEQGFARQISAQPLEVQRLLLVAAADPSGDPLLVWRAAERLGIGVAAAGQAADAGLAQFGTRVQFRHPLVRSAAYWSAAGRDRRAAHAALAEATDPDIDPDQRAWHRAQAAAAPDEDIAAELERSAARARSRGGLAAAAAFLERAAILTLDPGRRAGRAVAAAADKAQTGAFDAARDLLAMAEEGPLSDRERAQADLVRAQLAFLTNRGRDAPPLLLAVARRLAAADPGLSRATYLEAMLAALYAARLSAAGSTVREVAQAVAAAPPPPQAPSSADLLLDGLAVSYSEGYAAGLPILRRALAALESASSAERPRLLFLGCLVALDTWDDEHWAALSAEAVRLCRAAGALADLPAALSARALLLVFTGELPAAASASGEMAALIEATGSSMAQFGAMALAAVRGRQDEVSAWVETTSRDIALRGEGDGIAMIEWSNAVLGNGLGRYQAAMAAAQRLVAYDRDMGAENWGLAELVEAAMRCGLRDTATSALDRLTETTTATGTDWGLGVAARCRALVSDGAAAERLYREAIARLGRTKMRPDLARAHLLFGEWLRREHRRAEARQELRTAHGMLESMGMDGFAERARRELQATGEIAVSRAGAVSDRQLTAQEAQIARLARDGLSNPEIGARLFLSARTVQYHLSKVFAKLDISSRGELYRIPEGDLAVTGRGNSASSG
jgi:DNA-binding CsgD family transcriptional regulator